MPSLASRSTVRSHRTLRVADANRPTPTAIPRRGLLLAATAAAWTLGNKRHARAGTPEMNSSPWKASETSSGLTEIRHFARGDRSLADRIHQIDSARLSIELAYYSVDSGQAAMAILESLRLAALRDVRVRLLMDGFKSRIPDGVIRILLAAGVEIRIFNTPCMLRPLRLNHRFHGKMLILDGQRLTTGSSNLEDAHFCLNPYKDFCDQDISLTGPIAQSARCYFNRLWVSDHSAPPRLDSGNGFAFDLRTLGQRRQTQWDKRVNATRCIRGFRGLLQEAQGRAMESTNYSTEPSNSRWVPSNQIRWITDCDFQKSCDCFQDFLSQAIEAAEHRITIESPYPALAHPTKRALIAAAKRGVQVQLLTNSLRSTDQINVYAAFQNDKRQLSRSGIRILEVSGDVTMHAKLMLIDGCFSLIGSHNFDARSCRLNLETSVAILDEQIHRDLHHAIRRRYANADAVPEDRRLWQHPSGTDAKRRIGLWLRRGIVPLYRSCL